MRWYGRRVLFLLLLGALILSPGTARAGDPWCLMFYGNQDAVVLGTVREAGERLIRLDVARVVSGEDPGRTVTVERASAWLGPEVAAGDRVLISLDRVLPGVYRNAHGVYRVSSLDPRTLKVQDGYCGPDGLAAVEWWLHHGGLAGGDFYGIGGKLFWRHQETGREERIYPPPGMGAEASMLPALTGTDDGLSGGGDIDRWLPAGLGMLLLALVMAAGWFWWCRRRGVS